MKRAALGVVALALASAAIWAVTGSIRSGITRPNVVLIIGCTVRRDQLGMYGGPAQVTPFLTARAGSGAVFDHGVTAATWTRAASTAILTGEHPASVGMVEPGPGPSQRRLAEQVTTMAEHFQAHGYQTFGATANPNLNEIFGFDQGYDHYVESTDLQAHRSAAKVLGPDLIRRAMAVLSPARDDRPLFASILFTDAHEPANVTPAEVARVHENGVSERVSTYRAMLRRFDDAVALWVHELQGLGLTADNTLFVLVNDHGEGLLHPYHHGPGHGLFTYPSTTRMPWIVWGGGVTPRRIGGMASQIDVFPTLAGLAGLPQPQVSGLDWSAQVRGGGSTTRTRSEVDNWFLTLRRSAVFSTEAHCHADAGPTQAPLCFDDERVEHLTEAPELARSLKAFQVEMDGAFRGYRHTQDAVRDTQIEQQLRALGYVDGGDGTVP